MGITFTIRALIQQFGKSYIDKADTGVSQQPRVMLNLNIYNGGWVGR